MSALLLIALPATRIAYALLALLIGGESAGIPLPGETALITGSAMTAAGAPADCMSYISNPICMQVRSQRSRQCFTGHRYAFGSGMTKAPGMPGP